MCKALTELESAMSSYAAGFEVGALPPADLAPALRSAGRIEKMAAALASMVAARMALAPAGPGRTTVRRAFRPGGRTPGRARAGECRRHVARGGPPGHRSRQDAGDATRAWTRPPGMGSCRAGRPRSSPTPWPRRPEAAADLVEKAGRWPSGSCKQSVPGPRRPRSTWNSGADRSTPLAPGVVHRPASAPFHLHAEGTGRRRRPDNGGAETAGRQGFPRRPEGGAVGPPRGYAWDALSRWLPAAARRRLAAKCYSASTMTPWRGATPPKARGVRGGRPRACERRRRCETSSPSGDPVLKAVVTKAKDVVGVATSGHGGRMPTRRRRSTGCTPPVPTRPAGPEASILETDHRIGWAKTHMTVLQDLDRLCGFDHWRKTIPRLGAGRGERQKSFCASRTTPGTLATLAGRRAETPRG